MVEAHIDAVAHGPSREETGKGSFDFIEQIGPTVNHQVRLLLPGKRRGRQVFSRRRGTDGNVGFRYADLVTELPIGRVDLTDQISRGLACIDQVTNLAGPLGEIVDVVAVEPC